MALTAKQERFVGEYLLDLNATQAAIRAGYEFEDQDGFYVYFLIDPRSEQIFYVGKGLGNRIKHHAALVGRGRSDNGAKCRVISEIHSEGLSVCEVVFASGMTEPDAFSLERRLISRLRDFGLTNISGGSVSSEEAAMQHAASILAATKPFDVWVTGMSEDIRGQVERVFGSPRKFYDWYVAQLQRYATEPQPREIVFKVKANG